MPVLWYNLIHEARRENRVLETQGQRKFSLGRAALPKEVALLKTITEFNIEARYEDYKEELKQRADRSYTQQYLNITKKLLQWF